MPIRRINADPVVLQMSYSPPFSQEELDQLDISLGITARATSVTGDDVDDDDIDDSETAQPVTPSAAPAKVRWPCELSDAVGLPICRLSRTP